MAIEAYLDEQFLKRYKQFEIVVIGVYNDANGTNCQYEDLQEGLEVLKQKASARNIHGFCIFKNFGLKLSGHIGYAKVKIKPLEVYYIGWQLLHLLEAVHSQGYVYNNMSF